MTRLLAFLQANPAAAFIVAVLLFAVIAGRVDDQLANTKREQDNKRHVRPRSAEVSHASPPVREMPVIAKYAPFPPERNMEDWPDRLGMLESSQLPVPLAPQLPSKRVQPIALPSPAMIVEPPAPAAPPLGATYLGSLTDAADKQVFVQYDNNVITLKLGQLLPNGWALEKFEADRIVFRHKPTNAVATISVRSDQ